MFQCNDLLTKHKASQTKKKDGGITPVEAIDTVAEDPQTKLQEQQDAHKSFKVCVFRFLLSLGQAL